MNARSFQLLLAGCALLAAGCPQKQQARTADAGKADAGKAAAAPPDAAKPDAVAAPVVIDDLAPRKLTAAPADQVLAEVARAHYDPERLGLREIDFTFRSEQKSRLGVTALQGKGTWRAGSSPTVELSSVTRDGKPLARDADGVNKRTWEGYATQAQRLLHGLGAGFLRPRIDQHAKAAGKVRLVDRSLELAYEDKESGRTVFKLGEGYRVLAQTNVSPVGVTRTMTYEHQIVGGRNLVTRAVLRVSMAKDNTVPRRAAASLRYSDGMSYAIRYDRAGKFYLPVQIERTVQGTEDSLKITLKPTRVVP